MLMIGADPELFVKKGKHFISGHIFPCGTKAEPRKTEHGAVQNDGLALECNIPPAESEHAFVLHIRSVLGDLDTIVKSVDPECSLVAQSVAPFDLKYLDSLPENVSELGCNPDYNAYTMDCNPVPDAKTPFRTGAGHIHVGWTEGKKPNDVEHYYKCASLVRELDYFVGLPLIKLDPNDKRRALYGKAGAFRPKPYGVEYRVPSNVWLSKEPWQRAVYNQTVKCFNRWSEGLGIVSQYRGFALEAINNNIIDWDKRNPEIAEVVWQ